MIDLGAHSSGYSVGSPKRSKGLEVVIVLFILLLADSYAILLKIYGKTIDLL